MKYYIVTILMLFFSLGISAEPPKNFDPEKFEADLEQFITVNAGLTPLEASSFFPLFREEQKQKRCLFMQKRRYRQVNMGDEKACANAILEMDRLDDEQLAIQAKYHKKYLKILPASKVLKIIKAEDKFHRQAFRQAFKKK